MNKITVRLFKAEDTYAIVELIRRNLLEVNIKDYDQPAMEQLAHTYNADKIKAIAHEAHLYVACLNNKIVGSGAIMPENEQESLLLTIFTLPEMQGQGIGKKIIAALEQDAYFLRAQKVSLFSSITALNFYLKLGYNYNNGSAQLDSHGLYNLTKCVLKK